MNADPSDALSALFRAVQARMALDNLSVSAACRAIGVSRATFYRVRQAAQGGTGYAQWNLTMNKMQKWSRRTT